MKITVEVDCTPAEARQFLGLPDVAPLQAAVLESMQQKMLSEIERFSPESVMKSWFSAAPLTPEKTQELFAGMFARGFGQSKE